MEQRNTIDGLDEMHDADFESKSESKSNDWPILYRLGEAVGWAVILVGFILALAYLTPPQRSAEADLFEAQMNGEAPK